MGGRGDGRLRSSSLGLLLLVSGALGCSPASPSASSSSSPVPNSAAPGALVPEGGAGSGDSPGSGGLPVQVRDDLGRTVSLGRPPRRIVSLLPSHTETVFALGLGDRVVAVDTHSDVPPEAARLPRVGDVFQLQLEALVAQAPDLVLLSDDARAAASLDRAGLPAWAANPRSLADVDRLTLALGTMLGVRERADALVASLHAGLELLSKELRPGLRPRVYLEIDPTPYAAGPPSFLGELLALAGGDNVVPATLGPFPRLSPEFLASSGAEVILGPSLEELRARPGLGSVPALVSGRVLPLSTEDRALLERPGPRLVEGARLLASKLGTWSSSAAPVVSAHSAPSAPSASPQASPPASPGRQP